MIGSETANRVAVKVTSITQDCYAHLGGASMVIVHEISHGHMDHLLMVIAALVGQQVISRVQFLNGIWKK